MADRYKAQREHIRGYAKDLDVHAQPFQESGHRIKTAVIESQAFTANGHRIAKAYDGIVAEYSWTSWRIGVTLDKAAESLVGVAKNYGEAEARVKDLFGTLGKQF